MGVLYQTDDATHFLEQSGARLLPLDAAELPDPLRRRAGNHYLLPVGWKSVKEVIVHLPEEFPDAPPLVFLTAGNIPTHVIPHVNSDGQICTLPVGCIINPYRPKEQIEAVAQIAQKVFESEYSVDQALAEIETELKAYWTTLSHPALFLKDNTVDTRCVVAVENLDVVPEVRGRKSQLVTQMPAKIPNQVGLVVDVPRERLIRFVESPVECLAGLESWKQSSSVLAALLAERNQDGKFITLFVLARCQTSQGVVWLGGLFQNPLRVRKGAQQIQEGLNTLLNQSPFQKRAVDDLRTERLVSRAEGSGARKHLMDYPVAIVGCGSVGSFVADMLARSGIRRLLLVDKEVFESTNLARHILDTASLLMPKAAALRGHIVRRFPESSIDDDGRDARHPEVIARISQYAAAFNIIATGDTNTDMTLSRICASGGIGSCCFIWVEANLQAGHLVYQPRRCSKKLVDLHGQGADGRFLYQNRIIANPDDAQCQDHACQFSFTPYSAADMLLFVAAVVRKVIKWVELPPRQIEVLRWRIGNWETWEALPPP